MENNLSYVYMDGPYSTIPAKNATKVILSILAGMGAYIKEKPEYETGNNLMDVGSSMINDTLNNNISKVLEALQEEENRQSNNPVFISRELRRCSFSMSIDEDHLTTIRLVLTK